ncbi:MAG: Ethanolamine utilization protein EutN [Verrucomicrobiota bacterium]|jgi:ethanolamine utilization protein EutN
MRIATIHGYATSTVKHRSLEGWRLLLAVPESPDLAPQIVLDSLGAAIGQRVLISSDGSEARKIVKDERSPARWTVMGIIDPERDLNVG